MCCGRRGHERLKAALAEELHAEWIAARSESARLAHLFKDMCWYNFETNCRSWNTPWHPSWGYSPITLNGTRATATNGREQVDFPIWYSGPVMTAPTLPIEIIFNELHEAAEYERHLEDSVWAPYDWAPGGRKYEQLLREGEGVRAFEQLQSSKSSMDNDGGGTKRKRSGDGVAGTAETYT